MTEEKDTKKFYLKVPPWYYFLRAFGVSVALYGLLIDKSPERGTIILTGVGLAGLDKVARSEKKE